MIVAREKAEYYGLPEKPVRGRRPRRRTAVRGLLRKERLALTGLVLLGFSCCLVIAFYYAQVLITGYWISMTEKELARLRVESHDLYTEVNQLASLENIEAIAVHELGMVKPQNDRIVIVEEPGPADRQVASGDNDGDGGTGDVALNSSKKEQPQGQNWLIRTFADMVGKLEASIRTG